jgi:hypothetical protein
VGCIATWWWTSAFVAEQTVSLIPVYLTTIITSLFYRLVYNLNVTSRSSFL